MKYIKIKETTDRSTIKLRIRVKLLEDKNKFNDNVFKPNKGVLIKYINDVYTHDPVYHIVKTEFITVDALIRYFKTHTTSKYLKVWVEDLHHSDIVY